MHLAQMNAARIIRMRRVHTKSGQPCTLKVFLLGLLFLKPSSHDAENAASMMTATLV